MSIQAVAWVLQHSKETYGDRLVLIALANHADEHGRNAWPSVETLGREAGLTSRQVQRCLRNLEGSGAIREMGIGSKGTHIYALNLAVDKPGDRGGDNMSPPDISALEGATSDASEGVADVARTVLVKQPSREQPSTPGAASETPLWKVDRRPVTMTEHRLALAVLAEWNQQAEQSLGAKTWLAKIVMRIREYPDLGIEEHAHIIGAALRDPWWKGPASPSVVYGSDAQFERSIAPGEATGTARGLNPDGSGRRPRSRGGEDYDDGRSGTAGRGATAILPEAGVQAT